MSRCHRFSSLGHEVEAAVGAPWSSCAGRLSRARPCRAASRPAGCWCRRCSGARTLPRPGSVVELVRPHHAVDVVAIGVRVVDRHAGEAAERSRRAARCRPWTGSPGRRWPPRTGGRCRRWRDPTWRCSRELSGSQVPVRGLNSWVGVSSRPSLPLCHGNNAPSSPAARAAARACVQPAVAVEQTTSGSGRVGAGSASGRRTSRPRRRGRGSPHRAVLAPAGQRRRPDRRGDGLQHVEGVQHEGGLGPLARLDTDAERCATARSRPVRGRPAGWRTRRPGQPVDHRQGRGRDRPVTGGGDGHHLLHRQTDGPRVSGSSNSWPTGSGRRRAAAVRRPPARRRDRPGSGAPWRCRPGLSGGALQPDRVTGRSAVARTMCRWRLASMA